MPKRSRRCDWCGEVLAPGEPIKFDTRDREAIYHEACLWGLFAGRGWSFLQRPGVRSPADLRFPCHACGVEVDTASESVWYERDHDAGGYRPYHPACAPSRVGD